MKRAGGVLQYTAKEQRITGECAENEETLFVVRCIEPRMRLLLYFGAVLDCDTPILEALFYSKSFAYLSPRGEGFEERFVDRMWYILAQEISPDYRGRGEDFTAFSFPPRQQHWSRIFRLSNRIGFVAPSPMRIWNDGGIVHLRGDGNLFVSEPATPPGAILCRSLTLGVESSYGGDEICVRTWPMILGDPAPPLRPGCIDDAIRAKIHTLLRLPQRYGPK